MVQPVTPSVPNDAEALASQGLTAADLEANRAGRVSPAQLARLDSVQKWGKATVYIMLGGLSVSSVVLATYHYLQHHDAPIFILPTIAIVFSAIIYFFVYRLNRLPMPAEIANATVSVKRAHVTGSLVATYRGVYNVWLDSVRYSGCATALSADISKKNRVVDAYIIEQHKLVVALVPAE